MPTLFIMQGAPGSGKSTIAKALAKNTKSVICSTDSYFYVDGEYRFNPQLLAEYHRANLENARYWMGLKECDVIVDNTNIFRSHVRPYVECGIAHGYSVQFIRCTGKFENKHGVPQEAVERMLRNMESLDIDSVMKEEPA